MSEVTLIEEINKEANCIKEISQMLIFME